MAMRGGRKVSDYEINGMVRRTLVSRNVDLQELQYRCSNGAVDLTGSLKFKEVKSISEVAKELFLLEEAILGIRGVRRVSFNLDSWEKSRSGQYVRKLETDKEDDKQGPVGEAPKG